MKAYLIDPYEGSIEQVEYSGDDIAWANQNTFRNGSEIGNNEVNGRNNNF